MLDQETRKFIQSVNQKLLFLKLLFMEFQTGFMKVRKKTFIITKYQREVSTIKHSI